MYLDYALHRTPDDLRTRLQDAISSLPSGATVCLGYGLCSNGTAGLRPGNRHLVIPRVHDCISLLLGSPEAYQRSFLEEPGTIYLSSGWIDNRGDPLSDYQRILTRYSLEDARWIFGQMYHSYSRLVFVETPSSSARHRRYAESVARWAGWSYCQVRGTGDLYRSLLSPSDHDPWLVVLEPGETLKQSEFLPPCHRGTRDLLEGTALA